MIDAKVRKAILKVFRNAKDRWTNSPNISRRLLYMHDRINKRADLRNGWQACEENGKIALIRSGMDCDGTQYYTVYHIDTPASTLAWEKSEDEHQQWLDGPEHVSFDKPSRSPIEHKSADRQLEAYEDGHPGTYYWGEL